MPLLAAELAVHASVRLVRAVPALNDGHGTPVPGFAYM